MPLPRRQFLRLAAGVAAFAVPSPNAWASPYPSRPVRVVSGFTPGGSGDILARLIGQWLSERLGQPFVIENRPGAGGNIATEAVVRAPPDGYSLLVVASSSAINATLYEKLNFNFLRDTAPIASFIRQPHVMLVNRLFPPKTIAELIAYAKANPGKINMASSGIGSGPHLVGELFKKMAGIDMTHVPYRGAQPGAHRPDCWACAGEFPRRSSCDRIYQRRHLAGIGGNFHDPLAGLAGRPDNPRIRAWLRGERLVRARRSSKYAR